MNRSLYDTRFPRGPIRRAQGFTLIELLAVIAIIAILAAILFPVFAQAKEAAKKANCISNLKQISLAFLMYADDYEESMPRTVAGGPEWDSIRYTWYGSYVGTPRRVKLQEGQLQPYMKNTPILDCASASGIPPMYLWDVVAPPVAYGVMDWLAQATLLSTIELPAETLLVGDAAAPLAASSSSERYLMRYEQIFPQYNFGIRSLHGRHNGTATIGWFDGHAKAYKLIYPTFPSDTNPGTYYITHEQRLQWNIGILAKYPLQSTSYWNSTQTHPNGGARWQYDAYYYIKAKRYL